MRYKILITHCNGTHSYMAHNNRTAWERRCATRHLNEFIEKLAAGYSLTSLTLNWRL